jgi:hypothetical protein
LLVLATLHEYEHEHEHEQNVLAGVAAEKRADGRGKQYATVCTAQCTNNTVKVPTTTMPHSPSPPPALMLAKMLAQRENHRTQTDYEAQYNLVA